MWVEGDDTSTIYFNDWINPKGKSYIDVAIRIRGIKVSKSLNLYVPFFVTKDEIEDLSLHFKDTKSDYFFHTSPFCFSSISNKLYIDTAQ